MEMPSFSLVFAGAFIAAAVVGTALRLWLAGRQIAAVRAHRSQVPEPFAARVSLADHQKAADYTVASVRLGRWSLLVDVIVTLLLTVGGGIGAIDQLWQHTAWPALWRGALVIASVVCLTALIDLPS